MTSVSKLFANITPSVRVIFVVLFIIIPFICFNLGVVFSSPSIYYQSNNILPDHLSLQSNLSKDYTITKLDIPMDEMNALSCLKNASRFIVTNKSNIIVINTCLTNTKDINQIITKYYNSDFHYFQGIYSYYKSNPKEKNYFGIINGIEDTFSYKRNVDSIKKLENFYMGIKINFTNKWIVNIESNYFDNQTQLDNILSNLEIQFI